MLDVKEILDLIHAVIQAYHFLGSSVMRSFVKTTGWAIRQVDGRLHYFLFHAGLFRSKAGGKTRDITALRFLT